ncbi:MAG: hypothetical protein U0411_02605 [Thermodesulfovibrionales bacterium]
MKCKMKYPDIVSKAFSLLAFFTLFFIPFTTGLAFEVHTYRAAPPDWPRIIDPEFDDVHFRALYQDDSGNLFVINLDVNNGGVFVRESKSQIASGLAEVDYTNANGPAWVYGADYASPAIIYTATGTDSVYRLKIASQDSNTHEWTSGDLTTGNNRYCALATNSETIGNAKILYKRAQTGGFKEYWRTVNDPTSEEFLLSNGHGQAHFSSDGVRIALTQPCDDGGSVRQPMIYNTENGTKRCVRRTNNETAFPYFLKAEEFNGRDTMMYTLVTDPESGRRIIVVDQRVTGTWEWELTNFITPQDPDEWFVTSPEAFKAANGKWYVVYASVSKRNFYEEPDATGSIWIASLDPDDPEPIHRRITPDPVADAGRRFEPEALRLPNGDTIIYYTVSAGGNQNQLWIARTGL